MKIFCVVTCLMLFALSQQVVYTQQPSVTEPRKESAEGFVKLEMPLEEALTKISFIVTWLSGDGNDEVIFEGEGVTHYPDRIVLTEKHEIYGRTSHSSYTIFPQHTVESNRYIFVLLADWGGGSGVFLDLNVVDKKTLKSVDDVALGDRSRIEEIALADAHSDTVSITYIRREVKKGEPLHDPKKAIKKHFRMIGGILQEVENPFSPSDADEVLTPDQGVEVSGKAQILLSPSDPNMVLIPAGEFQMGSNDKAFDGEKWIHTVYVDAFYMDIYEVTNAQYKMFVDANPQWQKDHVPWRYHDGNYLKDWDGNNYPIGKGDHPVANVSWHGARAYAKWVDKRLPTQAEWEKAARGGLTGQRYPWGNSIDFSNANYARNVGGTTPVGSYPPNRYGLYDMVGNVWEWCLDGRDRDFYKTSPGRNPIAGADSVTDIINGFFNRKSWRVLRGGSWIRFAREVKISDADHSPSDFSNDDFGFRCVKPITPSDMVLIPAGEFKMGSNDNDAENDEKPRHTVYIDAFYIDKYEVTNAQYKKFIDANPQWRKDRILRKYHDGDYLKHWDENNYPPADGDHPIVYVSWYAAMAYAEWRGKRLPTEAEWEKAARGDRYGRDYAWGDSLDSNKANYGENIGDTTPVGNYDMNGYGLYDMTGNVWEWCLDEYDSDFYSISPRRNPVAGGTVSGILSNWRDVRRVRVLRGGSWISSAKFLRVSDRTRFTPRVTNKARGFRCVKPVTP